MHDNTHKEEDLIFCHSESNPNSLVMLCPSEKVIEKMLKPPEQICYLWVIEDVDT